MEEEVRDRDDFTLVPEATAPDVRLPSLGDSHGSMIRGPDHLDPIGLPLTFHIKDFDELAFEPLLNDGEGLLVNGA